MGLSCRHFIPDGERGKYLRQTRRLKTTESEPPARHARLRLESGDALGGRRHDACFRACPLPTAGSPAACRGPLRVSWKTGLPLLSGKKQGNSSDSAASYENLSRKYWESSYLRTNSLANGTGN